MYDVRNCEGCMVEYVVGVERVSVVCAAHVVSLVGLLKRAMVKRDDWLMKGGKEGTNSKEDVERSAVHKLFGIELVPDGGCPVKAFRELAQSLLSALCTLVGDPVDGMLLQVRYVYK